MHPDTKVPFDVPDLLALLYNTSLRKLDSSVHLQFTIRLLRLFPNWKPRQVFGPHCSIENRIFIYDFLSCFAGIAEGVKEDWYSSPEASSPELSTNQEMTADLPSVMTRQKMPLRREYFSLVDELLVYTACQGNAVGICIQGQCTTSAWNGGQGLVAFNGQGQHLGMDLELLAMIKAVQILMYKRVSCCRVVFLPASQQISNLFEANAQVFQLDLLRITRLALATLISKPFCCIVEIAQPHLYTECSIRYVRSLASKALSGEFVKLNLNNVEE